MLVADTVKFFSAKLLVGFSAFCALLSALFVVVCYAHVCLSCLTNQLGRNLNERKLLPLLHGSHLLHIEHPPHQGGSKSHSHYRMQPVGLLHSSRTLGNTAHEQAA